MWASMAECALVDMERPGVYFQEYIFTPRETYSHFLELSYDLSSRGMPVINGLGNRSHESTEGQGKQEAEVDGRMT